MFKEEGDNRYDISCCGEEFASGDGHLEDHYVEDGDADIEDIRVDLHYYLENRLNMVFKLLEAKLKNEKIIYWILKFIMAHASGERLGDEFRAVTGYKFMKVVDSTSCRIYFGLLWDIMHEVRQVQKGRRLSSVNSCSAMQDLFDKDGAGEESIHLPQDQEAMLECANHVDQTITEYVESLGDKLA
jgi:hypothetical protein